MKLRNLIINNLQKFGDNLTDLNIGTEFKSLYPFERDKIFLIKDNEYYWIVSGVCLFDIIDRDVEGYMNLGDSVSWIGHSLNGKCDNIALIDKKAVISFNTDTAIKIEEIELVKL